MKNVTAMRFESQKAERTPTSVPIGDVVLVARDVGARHQSSRPSESSTWPEESSSRVDTIADAQPGFEPGRVRVRFSPNAVVSTDGCSDQVTYGLTSPSSS